ncbi:MarR family transcriptional regulator [Rhizobium oryziradicis]|uniref:MarR family transcriptional regulator n=2 Tax=Rhizobium oryziradicis TaxID=1867956 RepID=A0A1Q8ZTY2_9HYPH|nr:MarR family transcriptional regulator [Rhizobium oryziradicis]
MMNADDLNTETTPALDASIDGIANTMSHLRMMMGRRFMSRIALSQLAEGHGMELSHFDIVKIVAHTGQNQEVTVGSIAEQMRIDPSRASRIVADLVRQGMLQRGVSQQDARRAIVTLTKRGKELNAHFERVRREVLGHTLEGWSLEDIRQFEQLFDRFIKDLDCRTPKMFKEMTAKQPQSDEA